MPTSGVACLSPDLINNPAPIGLIRVEFDEPVDGVGAYFLDAETPKGAGSYIEVFDANDISIEKLWVGEWPDKYQAFAGIVSAPKKEWRI